MEIFTYYDTNADGAINPEDDIDSEHYANFIEHCDFNDDGTIDQCEAFDCVIMAENAWRD
jgi:hypothetical protein